MEKKQKIHKSITRSQPKRNPKSNHRLIMEDPWRRNIPLIESLMQPAKTLDGGYGESEIPGLRFQLC